MGVQTGKYLPYWIHCAAYFDIHETRVEGNLYFYIIIKAYR